MTKSKFSISIQKLLKEFKACKESIVWASEKHSLEDLWQDCPDPEWLLTCLKGLDYYEEELLRKFAISCANRHTKLFPDKRCSEILHIADSVAEGKK